MEFLLTNAPLVAGSWYEEIAPEDGGYLRIRLARNSFATGASPHLEISGDLEHWMRIGRERVVGQNGDGLQAVEVVIPPMRTEAPFLRIRAVASE
jgi:hypothetical protein